MLPIILLLGPCGVGKSTLATSLLQSHPTRPTLHHISVGAWLRALSTSPIPDVPSNMNECIALDHDIPEAWLISVYGPPWQEIAPPAVVYHVCSKRNISTPSSMWIRLLPALEAECQRVKHAAATTEVQAILLDGFPKTIDQALAFDASFSRNGRSPIVLALSLTCATDIIFERFLSRSRGDDDTVTFERRLRRFETESPMVLSKFQAEGKLAEVRACGAPAEVYRNALKALEHHQAWRQIFDCSPASGVGASPDVDALRSPLVFMSMNGRGEKQFDPASRIKMHFRRASSAVDLPIVPGALCRGFS